MADQTQTKDRTEPAETSRAGDAEAASGAVSDGAGVEGAPEQAQARELPAVATEPSEMADVSASVGDRGTHPAIPSAGDGLEPAPSASPPVSAPPVSQGRASAEPNEVAGGGPEAPSAPEPSAESPEGQADAAAPESKVAPETEGPAEQKPSRFALPREPSARRRLFAFVGAVVVAMGLGALAVSRRPGLPTVTVLGADGGDSDAAGAGGSEPEQSVALPGSSAQALPGPKDPAPVSTAPRVWRVASYKDDPNATLTEGTVGKRTLSGALAHAGMHTSDVHRLLKAFEGKKKLDRSRPKDTFVFAVDKAKGRLVAFELSSGPSDVWQAREENDALVVKKLELSVERRKIAVGFAVDGELHEAVTRAGLDDDALKRLDDALDGHFELSDLRPGTRLRMVLTELRVEGAFSRYAQVDAVEVRPPTGNGQVRVYRFDDEPEQTEPKDGKPEKHRHKREHPSGYFDAKGHQPYHGGWRSPVPGARISSRFNPHRLHPVLHVVMPHNGIDFAAPTGAKVYAASAGTVIVAGNGGPCGNMVQIEHPGGLVTAYCHLSRFAAGLHPGQHVDTRQLVGYVGATGRVTGPHLHFALKKNAQFVDPMSLKMDGVRVLPPGDREAFAAARQALDAALDAVALPATSALADAGVKDEEVFDEGDEDDAGSKPDSGN